MSDEVSFLKCDICLFDFSGLCANSKYSKNDRSVSYVGKCATFTLSIAFCVADDIDQHRPIALPCGHSLCASCFREDKETCTMEGRNLACSFCRKPFPASFVPPTNFALTEVLNGFAKMKLDTTRSAPINRTQHEQHPHYFHMQETHHGLEDSRVMRIDTVFIVGLPGDYDEDRVAILLGNIGVAICRDSSENLKIIPHKTREGVCYGYMITCLTEQMAEVAIAMLDGYTLYPSLARLRVTHGLFQNSTGILSGDQSAVLLTSSRAHFHTPVLIEDDNDRKVFVDGLPLYPNEDKIVAFFSQVEEIDRDYMGNCKMTTFNISGRNDSKYVITYRTRTAAQSVIDLMNKKCFPGTTTRLKVSRYKPKPH